MFIELAQYLRCPRPHEDSYLVLSTGAMKERHVLFGTIGCPVCHSEFPLLDGVARLGQRPRWPGTPGPVPPAADVHAVLGLASPGGYIVLVGSATGLATELSRLLDGVHLICLNPADQMGWDASRRVVHATDLIPLRDAVARAVVLGSEALSVPWIPEAARVLLRGQRLVALAETLDPPAGIQTMAVGRGMWVGKKT
jgi:hypothetical protein